MGVADGEIDVEGLGVTGVVLVSAKTILAVKKERMQISVRGFR